VSAVGGPYFDSFISYIILFINVSAGLTIGISSLRALYSFLALQSKPAKDRAIAKETVRITLDSGLLLGIDFEVGSDVLTTVLVPSITDLIVLAVVVALRVILSWSLTRETNSHDAALINRGETPIAGRKTGEVSG